jgi:hypothetical protein
VTVRPGAVAGDDSRRGPLGRPALDLPECIHGARY